MDEVMAEVWAEMDRADSRFGDFRSSHEGLGVLIEEMDELRQAVRANAVESIRDEAIQVAAVAIRLARACRTQAFRERSIP